jgi:hypothetical protein
MNWESSLGKLWVIVAFFTVLRCKTRENVLAAAVYIEQQALCEMRREAFGRRFIEEIAA